MIHFLQTFIFREAQEGLILGLPGTPKTFLGSAEMESGSWQFNRTVPSRFTTFPTQTPVASLPLPYDWEVLPVRDCASPIRLVSRHHSGPTSLPLSQGSKCHPLVFYSLDQGFHKVMGFSSIKWVSLRSRATIPFSAWCLLRLLAQTSCVCAHRCACLLQCAPDCESGVQHASKGALEETLVPDCLGSVLGPTTY